MKSTAAITVAALLCGLAPGCGDNLAPIEAEPGAPSERSLFASDRIWDIHISLDDGAIAALGREPREYVVADVRVGDLDLSDVGVRLKGTFSFQGLSGKAAFKIRFDKFIPGQSIGSIHRLTLNNMRQSRGMVSEWLGYQVFAAAGVPAPRAGYARVWVNGELYGLYANVETEDEHFLARHFDDPSGNLYEAELTDLTDEEIDDYEQEQGTDMSRQDLAALAQAIADPSDGLFFDQPALLAAEEFWSFVAAEAWTGHWDGYWKAHNYRLYADPGSGRFHFLPWGIDQTYERRLDPFDGAGVLTQKCFGSERCLAEYARAGRQLVTAASELDLATRLDDIAALIDESIEHDPRKPYGIDKIRRHQAAIRAYLLEQPSQLVERFRCADSAGELDEDDDGFGACLADCDDGNPDSHPGGSEICDGSDNDCDGIVDDLADCGCEPVTVGGVGFLLCVHPMPWVRANQHCAAQDAELATFDDAGQARAVFDHAVALSPASWYFAGNDRAEEGTWVGQDDPLPFTDWASDEPDSFGDEDCAVLDRFADGAWSDVACRFPYPFICR